MPQVMTTKAIVLCPHGGVGTSVPSAPFWNVQGGLVLRQNDVGTLTCPFLPPCVGYRLQSMGLNSSQLQGAPVILTTDFNLTFTGLPLAIIETHQVIDNSTPAPIPNGAPAPPLSPELLDTVPPAVVVATPAAAFVTATSLPATVPVTFTLTSPFPLKWILTRLSEPPNASNADLTNGDPSGAVVVPTGGAWISPSLTVTLTMSAAYMAALGPGKHHFYMTGVSKRGLSDWKECILTVS